MFASMLGTIVDTNCIELPTNCDIVRVPPRAPEDQQREYLSRFDFHGVFSDVFLVNGELVAVGPPYLNLLPFLERASFYYGETELEKLSEPRFRPLNRTSNTTFQLPTHGANSLEIEKFRVVIEGVEITCGVGRNYLSAFKGKNVLLTMNRDNDLINIVDWIDVNVRINEINAVLLYDNRSNSYSSETLLNEICAVQGVEVAIVVNWPHPYGVVAGSKQIWDSDFGQYTVWEDSRRRFLSEANSVTVGDVDEIPMSNSGRPCWQEADALESGVFYYRLRNVLPYRVGVATESATRRHRDFNYSVADQLGSFKYTYIPAKLRNDQQLLVHQVTGASYPQVTEGIARHFNGLHRRWRDGSFGYTAKELEDLPLNATWDGQLASAFSQQQMADQN